MKRTFLLFTVLCMSLYSCSSKNEVSKQNVTTTSITQNETENFIKHDKDSSLQKNSISIENESQTDCTKNYFMNCFDKELSNYEFYVRNPLLISRPELFFKTPELMKNKILKISKESYDIGEDGLKHWADTYDRTVDYDYFFFDEDFRITDHYYIEKTENTSLSTMYHISYKCNNDSYVMQETIRNDFKKVSPIEHKTLTYKIQENEDSIVFEDAQNKHKFAFTKNEMTEQDKEKITSFKFEKNTLTKSDEYRVIEYADGQMIYYLLSQSSGDKMTFENTGEGTFIKYLEKSKGENIEKIARSSITRRFNNIGFMEHEYSEPYESNEGEYSIMNAEIIDVPDEEFNNIFVTGWDKQ